MAPRRFLRAVRAERGVSVVEMSVALFGLAFVASAMIGFFSSITSTDAVHRADDAVLEDVRNARSLMSRDVREARRFTQVFDTSFTIWIDDGWDDVMDPQELITWRIDASGSLVRIAGSGPLQVTASSIDESASWLTYDAAVPSDVGSVDVHLEVISGGSRHVIDTNISLRNVP